MRYPLVEGHGNFGSIDGDPPAAYRYTEARMARLSNEMLRDLEKETVDWVPNFDETRKEPRVLPSRFPNLLVNGSSGIAVGMTTNIPPHNLREVIDAVVCVLDNPEAELDDLMEHIKGPDFPTRGIIMGRAGIRAAYATGRGRIRVRARSQTEEFGQGRFRIIVTELPYQVNKARLIESIAEQVKEKRLEGISGLRDESDRDGMRIVIELKRDANPQVVENRLFSQTQLQVTFAIVMLALVEDQSQPRILPAERAGRVYRLPGADHHPPSVLDRRKAQEHAPSAGACSYAEETSTRSSASSAAPTTRCQGAPDGALWAGRGAGPGDSGYAPEALQGLEREKAGGRIRRAAAEHRLLRRAAVLGGNAAGF